jgi:hypothetical protein
VIYHCDLSLNVSNREKSQFSLYISKNKMSPLGSKRFGS